MDLKEILGPCRIIPAVKHMDDLAEVLMLPGLPVIFLLGGDINTLGSALTLAGKYPHKYLFAHLDLLNGIGKDEAGVRYLKDMGLEGIVSVKWQLLQYAKKHKMLTVLRLFMIDSEALCSGLKMIPKVTPDAIEILPASVPPYVIGEFRKVTDLCILGGGLLRSEEDARLALSHGLTAVTASRRNIWNMKLER